MSLFRVRELLSYSVLVLGLPKRGAFRQQVGQLGFAGFQCRGAGGQTKVGREDLGRLDSGSSS